MKKTIRILALTGAVALAASPAHALPGNLLLNGSFESGDLTSWDSAGAVGVYNSEGSTSGANSAIFNAGNAAPSAVLSQLFTTVPGVTYTLDFDYGTYGAFPGQSLDVAVFGTTPLVNTTAVSAPGAIPTSFSTFEYTFTADSTSTRLLFADDSGNITASNDGILDNVIVTATPEPATLTLLALPLGALALRKFRRNRAA